MSESKALVPVNKETWQVIQSVAPVAQASRMFGVTQEQAAIVMLKGHELGLGIASAFEYIHVIDQKPSLSPKGALALIHRSGELAGLQIEDLSDDQGNPIECRVTMKRKNGFAYTTSYTMDDAERAGVVKDKSGWAKYPANMLRWRAVGYCADIVFPDVVGGLYRPEELGADVDASGEPLEQWEVVESDATEGAKSDVAQEDDVDDAEAPESDGGEPQQATAPNETTLQTILDAGFTAEQIMVANEGRIPGTAEECEAVLAKLQEGESD
ncbi:MAG: recombinase RecT [Anaerolineae bacterium]